jgi:hypothetical protein
MLWIRIRKITDIFVRSESGNLDFGPEFYENQVRIRSDTNTFSLKSNPDPDP